MIIDRINLNHLRIFECVYRVRSMTDAARELHLTQSGVSQHVRTLEDSLAVKLIDRINQKLVPTASAARLFEQCSKGLTALEQGLAELSGEKGKLSGTVRIGMPIEFGNNILLPEISRFCRKHPSVRFALRYGFATEMNEGLMKGELDFAFVDDFALDRNIKSEKIYDEVLELCASPAYLKKARPKSGKARENREFFEELDYVDYQVDEPMLRMWFHHHLGPRALSLTVRATVMDVQGVARLILSGMGCGVLPGYLADKLRAEGEALHAFKGSGKPLKNSISVAYLPARTLTPAAVAAKEDLLAIFK